MNGAGVPLWLTDTIGEIAGMASPNRFNNHWTQWWGNGWRAAEAGALPTPASASSCGCQK